MNTKVSSDAALVSACTMIVQLHKVTTGRFGWYMLDTAGQNGKVIAIISF